MTDRDAVIYVEAPAALVDRLRAQAVREDRSVSSLVRVVMEAYVTEQEAQVGA